MMKPYPDSVLNYEKGFSIIINELKTPVENSICYYFDYDARSYSCLLYTSDAADE